MLLLVDDVVGVVDQVGAGVVAGLVHAGGLQVLGLHCMRAKCVGQVRLEGALLELLLYLFELLQVLLVQEDVVHFVKLLVPAQLLALLVGLAPLLQMGEYYLAVALSDGPQHFEECQLVLLLLGQILAVELDELEEDGLQQGLHLLDDPVFVRVAGQLSGHHHQSHKSVIDQPRRHVVVPEID